jgi:hypothetical protein
LFGVRACARFRWYHTNISPIAFRRPDWPGKTPGKATPCEAGRSPAKLTAKHVVFQRNIGDFEFVFRGNIGDWNFRKYLMLVYGRPVEL